MQDDCDDELMSICNQLTAMNIGEAQRKKMVLDTITSILAALRADEIRPGHDITSCESFGMSLDLLGTITTADG
jgi:hypothetical protein